MIYFFGGVQIMGSDIKHDLNIRIDYNVNLLHFVDHLSQWSQYTGDDARKLYLKYFEITEQDQKKLEKYSEIRNQLGWEAEINLFGWAYDSFKNENSPLDSKDLTEIKSIIEYFANRQNDKVILDKILKDKFDELFSLKSKILSYASSVEENISNIEPYLNIWASEIDFQKYPLYICFSHNENSTHGGANGQGVYSEFDISKNEKGISRGFDTITHELIHKVTAIDDKLSEFLKNDENYTEYAQVFMDKHKLDKKKLVRLFKSKDPEGFGNSEGKVFEEVNVYLFAPVLINHMDSLRITKTFEHYKQKEMKEFARTWHGVKLFKEVYDAVSITDYDKKEFIWSLIETFYEKIYYCNYSL
jgi:hypothetical protein